MQTLKQLIVRILEKFRPNPKLPEPTVRVAWERMYQMCDDYNDLCFYISQIKELDPPHELLKYMEKADYHMLSTRDELKIIMDRRTEHERIKERLRRNSKDAGDNRAPNHIRSRRPVASRPANLPDPNSKRRDGGDSQ